MCAMVKPHHISGMTKDIEQVKIRLKASILRNITLPLFSTSSVIGVSASSLSEPKKRRRVNTVDQVFNKEARDELDCIIVKIFYTGRLSFNLTRNP